MRSKLESIPGHGAAHLHAESHVPPGKLSEVLLDFGRPLLDRFTEPPPEDLLEKVMTIVVTVWNAHTLAMPCWSEPESLEELKDTVYGAESPPELAEAFELLSARRAERFREDPRAVGSFRVEVGAGGAFQLSCTPRLPDKLIPRSPGSGRGT